MSYYVVCFSCKSNSLVLLMKDYWVELIITCEEKQEEDQKEVRIMTMEEDRVGEKLVR